MKVNKRVKSAGRGMKQKNVEVLFLLALLVVGALSVFYVAHLLSFDLEGQGVQQSFEVNMSASRRLIAVRNASIPIGVKP